MDSRICQTSTASPAEPGGLSFLARVFDTRHQARGRRVRSLWARERCILLDRRSGNPGTASNRCPGTLATGINATSGSLNGPSRRQRSVVCQKLKFSTDLQKAEQANRGIALFALKQIVPDRRDGRCSLPSLATAVRSCPTRTRVLPGQVTKN